MGEYIYTQNTASKKDVYTHLTACNDSFFPPLNTTVNIESYSEKITMYTLKFEAWNNGKLVSLIAAYFNDFRTNLGFITNVSTLPNYVGNGLAKKLLIECIDHARNLGLTSIRLQVHMDNYAAIKLYKKFDFIEIELQEKLRTMQLDLLKSE